MAAADGEQENILDLDLDESICLRQEATTPMKRTVTTPDPEVGQVHLLGAGGDHQTQHCYTDHGVSECQMYFSNREIESI